MSGHKKTWWGWITGNWKKGAFFLIPIIITVWVIGLIVTYSVTWYLGLTQDAAEWVVFDLLEFVEDSGWVIYAAETLVHLAFIIAVLAFLFVLAEIIGTRYGQQLALWLERQMELVPVGGVVYKALRLMVRMLDSDEGERLITGVGLTWSMDGLGHVQYRSCYVIGSGMAKLRDEEYGPDTIIVVYFGHAPNPSSGNCSLLRKVQIIPTAIELGTFATDTAMLGHGLDEIFQPYVDEHLKELRAAGHQVFDGLRPNRSKARRPGLTLRPVEDIDGAPAH